MKTLISKSGHIRPAFKQSLAWFIFVSVVSVFSTSSALADRDDGYGRGGNYGGGYGQQGWRGDHDGDRGGYGYRHRGWGGGHDRDRGGYGYGYGGGYRPGYPPQPYGYAQPIYAPPPVYVPPPMYNAPRQAPGVNLIFPLNIR